MDSAAWLCRNVGEKEPEIDWWLPHPAQTGRRWSWKILKSDRFYFQNAGLPGEICVERKQWSSDPTAIYVEKTAGDCLRSNNKMPEEVKEEILTWCRKQNYPKEEILAYTKQASRCKKY